MVVLVSHEIYLHSFEVYFVSFLTIFASGKQMKETLYDLAIVGGGINGCGIARDAAGRGLSVFLCEQGDLASGTSSATSMKLKFVT